MPRALKVCSKPGCPELVPHDVTRCPEHQPAAWANSDRRSRLPSDWPRRRLHVLDRDGWQCRIRDEGCRLIATEVDHIEPGDDHSMGNLQAACRPCHTAKTQRESAEARRR